MRFVSLQDLGPHQVDELRLVYESSFPRRQRVPLQELLDGGSHPERVHLAGLINGNVAAMLVISWLPSIGWWFLEYLAVAEQSRDRGLGTETWNEALEQAGGAEAARIVLEVEPPSDAAVGSEERHQRERRVRFYERRGVVTLPIASFMAPTMIGDATERFQLMARPAANESPPDSEQSLALARSLLIEGYGLDPSHPLVSALSI
jgi:ribosomal protein S18 acetylase RimI-like enzyme